MGTYDTITVPCPTCAVTSEFQTKSGERVLAQFQLATAPNDALFDVNRHAPNVCANCATIYSVDVRERLSVVGAPPEWAVGSTRSRIPMEEIRMLAIRDQRDRAQRVEAVAVAILIQWKQTRQAWLREQPVNVADLKVVECCLCLDSRSQTCDQVMVTLSEASPEASEVTFEMAKALHLLLPNEPVRVVCEW